MLGVAVACPLPEASDGKSTQLVTPIPSILLSKNVKDFAHTPRERELLLVGCFFAFFSCTCIMLRKTTYTRPNKE
jgi:hypothetical protein